jgi:hypothetical protein
MLELDPTLEGIAVCPAPAKTASPSFIALPLIFKSGTYSSTASAQVEKIIFLIDVTFVGTVKELLWQVV